MYVTHTHTLSPRETDALRRLTDRCRLADGLSLSFPADGSDYWILENDQETVEAYFAACMIDDGLWECYAFTCPDCRGKGHFSRLLDLVCDYSRKTGDPVLAFVTDERCPQTLKILEHLKATYSHSEYMMSLPLSLPSEGLEEKGMILKFREEPESREEDVWEEGLLTVAGWPVPGSVAGSPWEGSGDSGSGSCGYSGAADTFSSISGVPAVTCRIMIEGRRIYLFCLETRPECRRRGLARRFLLQLARELTKTAAYDAIFLQVSGTNEAAVSLYKKTGFRITETLSYYLY